jgi:protein-tyrosine phosphatase
MELCNFDHYIHGLVLLLIKVSVSDIEQFDLIVAMDSKNLECLESLCPAEHRHKLRLFLPTYAPHLNLRDTPDPYYEGMSYL